VNVHGDGLIAFIMRASAEVVVRESKGE
jgi:hypothetical protein